MRRQFPPVCVKSKQNQCRQNPCLIFLILSAVLVRRKLFSQSSTLSMFWRPQSETGGLKIKPVFSSVKLTFAIELDGVTVRLGSTPRAVEDGSSLCDVSLCGVGFGSSDHDTCTANMRQREKACCKSTGLHFPKPQGPCKPEPLCRVVAKSLQVRLASIKNLNSRPPTRHLFYSSSDSRGNILTRRSPTLHNPAKRCRRDPCKRDAQRP